MAQPHAESDPRSHTTAITRMLTDVVAQMRGDVHEKEPKAQALFERRAEC
jgi:hypothetical protein